MSTEYPEVRRLVDSLARLMKPLLDQHIPQTLAPAFSGEACYPSTSSPYLSCFFLLFLFFFLFLLLFTCHFLLFLFLSLFLLLLRFLQVTCNSNSLASSLSSSFSPFSTSFFFFFFFFFFFPPFLSYLISSLSPSLFFP